MAEPHRDDSNQSVPAGAAARAAAALALHAVRDRGRSLPEALKELPALNDERDKPLVQELCYGALRALPRLEALAGLLLHKPLKRDDGDLLALLLIGLYQLTDTRIPDHAAVAATVEAARTLGKVWASALVNALLRRFLREREQLLARAQRSPSAKWLFPDWLLRRFQSAWPDDWQTIVAASNARPPMTLRVNRLRSTRAAYAARLAAAGLTARPTAYAGSGLRLDSPVPTAHLPGFADGLVSVQDAGAQLAADLLDAAAGDRVLDACAAPGGKTAHILERAGDRLDLTALDADPKRLERVRENLQRLGLSARIQVGDAAAPAGEWAQAPFDRILLDAPCSATGVVRRHPDIKWLRRESDIAALSELQARMLDSLWHLLAPGGTLLYATCSLLPEENERRIQDFLGRRTDSREMPLDVGWGVARAAGRQTLPQEGGMDGFYYAKLKKEGA
ncbi:MAG: 16S rRNA (cytosine(967)-C(5))-methyltransferase RsmB [Pseudomonadota bacterium]|nr:16S rRNA (cytosine(967)-C(5))-methyltransferase RsmB [Pseudomonadota bacterium]